MNALQAIGLNRYYGAEPDITRAPDGDNPCVKQGGLRRRRGPPAAAGQAITRLALAAGKPARL